MVAELRQGAVSEGSGRFTVDGERAAEADLMATFTKGEAP